METRGLTSTSGAGSSQTEFKSCRSMVRFIGKSRKKGFGYPKTEVFHSYSLALDFVYEYGQSFVQFRKRFQRKRRCFSNETRARLLLRKKFKEKTEAKSKQHFAPFFLYQYIPQLGLLWDKNVGEKSGRSTTAVTTTRKQRINLIGQECVSQN